MSLEIVPPLAKRPNSMTTRRVKSYEEGRSTERYCRDYDRHKITQFIRRPTTNSEDLDGCGGIGGDEPRARVRSKVRYNDTGSFEEVDEEKVELLLGTPRIHEDQDDPYPDHRRGSSVRDPGCESTVVGISSSSSREEPVIAGVHRYRELWRLRATLEESEEFSDVIRMDEITSPDEPSSEDLPVTSLTTSFESNVTEPVRRVDAPVTVTTNPMYFSNEIKSPTNLVASCGSYVHSGGRGGQPMSSLVFPSQESRRQSYRKVIAERMANRSCVTSSVTSPRVAVDSFDSIDTMETDGDVSDTSRQEVTTTSFDSTTTTTTTTTDNNTDADSQPPCNLIYRPAAITPVGYPSDRSPQRPTSDTPSIYFDPPASCVDPGISPTTLNECDVVTTKSKIPGDVTRCHKSAYNDNSQRLIENCFERRSVKTASKKRRQYRTDRRVWQIYESINELGTCSSNNIPTYCGSPTNNNNNNNLCPRPDNSPMSDGGGSSGSACRWAEMSYQSGISTFSRFLRYHMKGPGRYHSRRRDYSVDPTTDAVFNEFLRYDPKLEKGSRRSNSPRLIPRSPGLDTVTECVRPPSRCREMALCGGGGGSGGVDASSIGANSARRAPCNCSDSYEADDVRENGLTSSVTSIGS